VPNPANEAQYKRYAALAEAEGRVHFIGRLAQYRYYNMDQVTAAALVLCDRLVETAVEERRKRAQVIA
jgi:UDP-galactopyranose mutase